MEGLVGMGLHGEKRRPPPKENLGTKEKKRAFHKAFDTAFRV